jgi:hypothetical protein
MQHPAVDARRERVTLRASSRRRRRGRRRRAPGGPAPVCRPRGRADEAVPLEPLRLGPGEVGVGAQVVEVEGPQVDLEPGLLEPRGRRCAGGRPRRRCRSRSGCGRARRGGGRVRRCRERQGRVARRPSGLRGSQREGMPCLPAAVHGKAADDDRRLANDGSDFGDALHDGCHRLTDEDDAVTRHAATHHPGSTPAGSPGRGPRRGPDRGRRTRVAPGAIQADYWPDQRDAPSQPPPGEPEVSPRPPPRKQLRQAGSPRAEGQTGQGRRS